MRYHITIAAALVLAALSSCDRAGRLGVEQGGEIVLRVGTQGTKASFVESVPDELYVGITRGRPGSDEQSYLDTSLLTVERDGEGGTIATGRHQSAVPTAFNHYLSNVPLTLMGTGANVIAGEGTDVVCGTALQNVDENPSVELRHIFARTGGVKVTSTKGYAVTDAKAVISSLADYPVTGTSGVFSLTAWKWVSSVKPIGTPVEYAADMLVIPGTYLVTVTYTLTKGDFVKQYTVTGRVNLAEGSINTVTADVDIDEAKPITLGVSLNPWGITSTNLIIN